MRTLPTAFAVAAFIVGPALAEDAKPNPDFVPEKMPFDVPYGPPITLERADAVIAAAVAECKRREWKVNVAVVDSGSNLVAFARMDGGQIASVPIAQHKARAAAGFRRETKFFETAIANGAINVTTIDGVIGSRGGVPLIEDGKLIGAIGVSGATSTQDEVCAKAGVAALK